MACLYSHVLFPNRRVDFIVGKARSCHGPTRRGEPNQFQQRRTDSSGDNSAGKRLEDCEGTEEETWLKPAENADIKKPLNTMPRRIRSAACLARRAVAGPRTTGKGPVRAGNNSRQSTQIAQLMANAQTNRNRLFSVGFRMFLTDGERGRIRTCDPCLKRALLYQLSYAPTQCPFIISASRPDTGDGWRET
jgi:hypothetical protein